MRCSCEIVVGVLSQGDKYAIDTNHTFISSGGTAGYCMITMPERTPYSIYYIQSIIEFKIFRMVCFTLWKVFRGGLLPRRTKVLKKLPIRKIDFENIDEKTLHDDIALLQQRINSITGKY
jgi:hypothetical protein